MPSIKRILLTTNLAPHSDRAMERAVQLADRHEADLAALYAIEPRGEGLLPAPYGDWSAHDIEAEMRRHLLTFPQAASLFPVVAAMRGKVEEVAARFAEMWGADLMVAGAHAVDMPGDLFSVTSVERISVASALPLLVVRSKAFGPYASALVPVDFSSVSHIAMEWAFRLVPQGSIHVLHADAIAASVLVDAPLRDGAETTAHFREQFDRLLARLPISGQFVDTCVRRGFPMPVIAEAADILQPDLIVMGTAGRSGIGRTMLGSTAHEALERLPFDVVLVRAP